jgi:hypothetical protein
MYLAKGFSEILALLLKFIFNPISPTQVFSAACKKQLFFRFLKEDNKGPAREYTPTARLSALSDVSERFIHEFIYGYHSQYGFLSIHPSSGAPAHIGPWPPLIRFPNLTLIDSW